MSVCEKCKKEITGKFCPYCGYHNTGSYNEPSNALPKESVLNGKYIIEKVLGQGGFGITYAARDFQSKQLFTIKEFFPSDFCSRTQKIKVTPTNEENEGYFNYGKNSFLTEASTIAALNSHPNIVKVYEYFEENETAYYVMEYLDGEDFMSYIKRNGNKLSWDETKAIIAPVMDALSFIHSKGIIHRDISPDNIFLCKNGDVKLIDFGSARYSLGDKSKTLTAYLKQGYAPFEQYQRRSKQGPFTDVYSLGATIYRAITGKTPPYSTERIYNDEYIEPSSLNVDISPSEEAALSKALAVQSNDRFQTIADFRKALSAKPKKSSKLPIIIIVIIVVAGIIGVSAFLILNNSNKSEKSEEVSPQPTIVSDISTPDEAETIQNNAEETTENKSALVDDLLTEIEKFTEIEDYKGAIGYINGLESDMKNDSRIAEKLDDCENRYRKQVIQNAEDAFKSDGYEAALDILKDAVRVLPNDKVIEEKIKEYEDYEPVPIQDLITTKGENYSESSSELDPRNNIYADVYRLEANAYMEIYTEKKYTYLSFNIIPTKDFDTDNDSTAVVKVYADEKLIYTSDPITYKTKKINSGNLDLRNVEYVRIELEALDDHDYVYYNNDIILSDAKVSK